MINQERVWKFLEIIGIYVNLSSKIKDIYIYIYIRSFMLNPALMCVIGDTIWMLRSLK